MRTSPKEAVETTAPFVACEQLRAWFDLPLGRSLQAVEARDLRAVLTNLYGTVALQVGAVGSMDLLETSNAPTRIVLDLLPAGASGQVRGYQEALPFDRRSVDVVVLPHTLDFAEDPHQVLREVRRVLSPEGHVIIVGFNPFGLWGWWRLLARHARRYPWRGQFVSASRMKDWLSLLDFEPVHDSMLYFRPPLQNERLMERLEVLDGFVGRWLPMTAAAYLLVAKKRVVGMTPLRPAWDQRKRLVSGLAEPAARVIHPHIPQWRLPRGG